ncbi:MAG: hypothetical protein EAZ92_00885 [Candidatus Kapaibacterium sp.]|nr:MAG: hypothetical protein EAZ92_00885 [Candidatus Kapabacteria bacterium]
MLLLEAENAALRAENADLRAENIALRAENADLRSRLGLNSSNSHKPPNTDGLAKKTATGLPKEKGKKQGGQQGHEDYTLKMVAIPDKIEIHHPTHCSCCPCAVWGAYIIFECYAECGF